MLDCAGADEGQRDGVCGRGGLLQSQQRHRERRQRGERSPQHQVMTLRDVTYPTGEVVVSSPNLPPAMVMSPRLNVLAKINSEGNSTTQSRPHSPLLLLLEKDIICR